MNELSINLSSIKRVPVRKGELGYGRPGMPLDHYYLDPNAPIDLYTIDRPMAILNLTNDLKITVVAYVNSVYYHNIETVENEPPGYEKIVLTWFDAPIDNGEPYDN